MMPASRLSYDLATSTEPVGHRSIRWERRGAAFEWSFSTRLKAVLKKGTRTTEFFRSMAARSLVVYGLAVFLFLSGYWHIRRPVQTEEWLSKPSVIRGIGVLLLLIAVPCVVWRGWFFEVLAALLVASGAWRVCFPRYSIQTQRLVYPRWIHGCLLFAGAIAILLLKP